MDLKQKIAELEARMLQPSMGDKDYLDELLNIRHQTVLAIQSGILTYRFKGTAAAGTLLERVDGLIQTVSRRLGLHKVAADTGERTCGYEMPMAIPPGGDGENIEA